MNIGAETLRAKLRLTIHRGGVGQRPNRLSSTHAVKAGETILSGMVITPVKNTVSGRIEWVKGVTGSSLPNSFYIAVDDSADGDAGAAGTFQGLSVRGNYELSTSQFATGVGVTYQVGDELTYDAATGLVKPATAGDIVIGHVVKDYAPPVDLGATYTDLKPDPATTVSSGVQGGVFTRAKETNAQNLERLRFETVAPYTSTTSA